MSMNNQNVEALDNLPSFVGNAKGVLRASGRRRGAFGLWDLEKWDYSWRNRSQERCWKNHRKTQYRSTVLVSYPQR